jgi:hypothetical protein
MAHYNAANNTTIIKAGAPKDTLTQNSSYCSALRELEAPSAAPPDERESPQTVEEEPERADPHPDRVESEEPVQRTWWRRVFRR